MCMIRLRVVSGRMMDTPSGTEGLLDLDHVSTCGFPIEEIVKRT
jgi:hypothetical protein